MASRTGMMLDGQSLYSRTSLRCFAPSMPASRSAAIFTGRALTILSGPRATARSSVSSHAIRSHRNAGCGPAHGFTRRFVEPISCRLAPSFRQRLLIAWSQPARPSCADQLGRTSWIADEKAMLHVGNRLAGKVKLGCDAIQAVGVHPDQRLGNDQGGIALVGDRDPIVSGEPSPGEPATKLAPDGRLVRAFARDAPAEAGAALEPRIVVGPDGPEVLQPHAPG